MADKTAEQQKVGEVLKEFAAKVTTSKTKERCRILAELEQCVTDNGESSRLERTSVCFVRYLEK